MKHTIIFVITFVFCTYISLSAQNSYSSCYSNNISKGNTAFNQGKYSEARTYYVNAKQCAGGNPTEAQNKINACDAKIRAQAKAEADRRLAEAEAAEAKRKAEAEAAESQRRAEQEAIAAKKRAEEAAEKERKAEEDRKIAEKRKAEETNCEFLTDVDGNRYRLVQLGSQCWMAENLRVTHYADGTSLGSENYYYPNDEYGKVKEYGYLYYVYEVLKCKSHRNEDLNNKYATQGICPNGWHVPTKDEWVKLFDYVSSQSQYTCAHESSKIAKSLASSQGWDGWHNVGCARCNLCDIGDNQSANNATGFSAMPAGNFGRPVSGPTYSNFGEKACFWSSSPKDYGNNKKDVRIIYIVFDIEESAIKEYDSNFYAISVRCIRN